MIEKLIPPFNKYVNNANASLFYNEKTESYECSESLPGDGWKKLTLEEVIAIVSKFMPLIRLAECSNFEKNEGNLDGNTLLERIFKRITNDPESQQEATAKKLGALIQSELRFKFRPCAPDNTADPYFEPTNYEKKQKEYYGY